MIRFLIVFICFFALSIPANANSCRSGLFSSIYKTTSEQTYADLSTGSLTYQNSVGHDDILMGSFKTLDRVNELIQSAQKNIYVQTWRFNRGSKLAKSFASGLVKLSNRRRKLGAKNPIHVWMMINVIASQFPDYEKKANEQFFDKYDLNNEFMQVHVGIFVSDFLATNHAKTVSVDDKVSVIMGLNISNGASRPNMFDLGFAVRGEIVHEINRDFVEIWHRYINSDQLAPTLPEQRLSKHMATNCLPIMFTRNEPYSPLSTTIRHSSINEALLSSIRQAKSTIDILTPDMNVKVFLQAIKEAILAKVKVRIVLSYTLLASLTQNIPTRGGENIVNVARLYNSLGGYTSRDYYCKYLQIRWYTNPPNETLSKKKHAANHGKFMAIDDRVTYIGSANMDNQSWVNSREIGLFLDDPALTKSWLNQMFNPIFSKATTAKECGGSSPQ